MMARVWTIAKKDLRLLVRDRGGMFFALVFPILMAIFFGAIFSGGGSSGGSGGGGGLRIAVVDEDQTSASAAFLTTLRGASELRVTTDREGEGGKREALSRTDAEDLVRRGEQVAYVVIPKGYGAEDKSLFMGEGRAIEAGVDPSRATASGMLEGILMKYAFQDFATVFQDPAAMRAEVVRNTKLLSADESMNPLTRMLLNGMFSSIDSVMANAQSQADTGAGEDSSGFNGFNPVKITMREVVALTKERRNAYAWTFPQGIMWGMAGCAAAFGISLVTERTRGTLVRLRAAPLSLGHILAGKGLACFVAILFVGTLLLLIARVGFQVVPVSTVLTLIGLTATALCFVGIMMLMSVLGRTEASAGGIGWAVNLVIMMVGGAAVPVEVMPGWMQSAASASPVKWGILAIEGGLWRGYSVGEMVFPCAILLGVGLSTAVLGIAIFRRLDS